MNTELTENEVVDNLVTWLQKHNYEITNTAYIRQQGDDVAAVSPHGLELFVECKGSISESGNKFDLWARISEALYTAIRDKESQRPYAIHAIAIPDVDGYRKLMDGLKDFCEREQIPVFWVRMEQNWDVWCDSLIAG